MAASRILIVDDDPIICSALEGALLSFGYSTVVVGDGVSALAAARADPPDLILLDQAMPGMTGLEVLAALQEDLRLRSIPIVFVTGQPERIPQMPGVAAVLGKPVRLGTLRETLRAALESGSTR